MFTKWMLMPPSPNSNEITTWGNISSFILCYKFYEWLEIVCTSNMVLLYFLLFYCRKQPTSSRSALDNSRDPMTCTTFNHTVYSLFFAHLSTTLNMELVHSACIQAIRPHVTQTCLRNCRTTTALDIKHILGGGDAKLATKYYVHIPCRIMERCLRLWSTVKLWKSVLCDYIYEILRWWLDWLSSG
jgi:hypothetical protein